MLSQIGEKSWLARIQISNEFVENKNGKYNILHEPTYFIACPSFEFQLTKVTEKIVFFIHVIFIYFVILKQKKTYNKDT